MTNLTRKGERKIDCHSSIQKTDIHISICALIYPSLSLTVSKNSVDQR